MAVREHYPDTAVLIFSGCVDRATWLAAMQIGVAGFLSKDHDVGEIAAALDVIAAGRGGVRSDGAQPRDKYSSRHPAAFFASVPPHPTEKRGADAVSLRARAPDRWPTR